MRHDEGREGAQPASDVGTGARADTRPEGMGRERPVSAEEHRVAERGAGAAGAASGAIVAGTVGTVILGPIGTAIGAAVGAMGGWWAGSAMKDVPYTDTDERHYRTHYAATHRRGRSFEDVSPGYYLGHIAARNPEYRGRSFAEIEPDLKRIWNTDLRARHGEWNDVRDYAREAYARGATEVEAPRAVGTGATADLREPPVGRREPDLDMGGTRTHHRAEFADPGPSGAHPEAGFFDRDIGSATPSQGDPQSDREDGMGPMIDRGGFGPRDDAPDKDAQRREM